MASFISAPINLPPFKLFSAESTGLRTASTKHINLKPPDKKSFPFKKKKSKKRSISTLPSRHKKVEISSTSI